MVHSEQLLLDAEGSLVELFGFSRITARVSKGGQIIELDGNFIVARPVQPLKHCQGPVDYHLGFVPFSLPFEDCREGGRIGRHIWMIRPQEALANCEPEPRVRLAQHVLASSMLK